MVLAPVAREKKGEFTDVFADMQARGYVRFRINGEVVEAQDLPALKKTEKHDIDVVVDRLGILTDETYFCLQLRMTMTSKLTGNRISTSLAETTRCVDGLLAEYTIHYHDTALVAREAGPPRPGAVKLEG
jgi:excinuclease UvrABC ATPase subunit